MSSRGSREPEEFSRYGAHEGVCQGCGQPTHYRRRGGRDTFNWHLRCYQRLYRRKTRGSFAPVRNTCAVCGKTFVVQGQRFARKTCSPTCAKVRTQVRKYKGVKFSQLHREGVCLGCGGRTFKRRRRRGRRDSFNWHGQCYSRVRRFPTPIRSKLISIHREFAEWLSAWEKRTRPRARRVERTK